MITEEYKDINNKWVWDKLRELWSTKCWYCNEKIEYSMYNTNQEFLLCSKCNSYSRNKFYGTTFTVDSISK